MWAPWRSQYVESIPNQERTNCFLCAASEAEDASVNNLLVFRSAVVVVVMNRYPYNAGHLLVAPRLHTGEFVSLSDHVSSQIMAVKRMSVAVLQRTLHPQAMNIGANLGAESGAGLPEHLHFHLVPRWNGDTNFMPLIANTKVINESLDSIWQRFVTAFAEEDPAAWNID